MARVAQLGYIGLGVSNVDEWEQFATGVLGLQTHTRDPDGSLLLRMDEYHHRFIVSPGDDDDLALVGWEVADEETLKAMADQLSTHDIAVEWGTPEEAEARAGRWSAQTPGPEWHCDGNLLWAPRGRGYALSISAPDFRLCYGRHGARSYHHDGR